jgi:hypothetical protein
MAPISNDPVARAKAQAREECDVVPAGPRLNGFAVLKPLHDDVTTEKYLPQLGLERNT